MDLEMTGLEPEKDQIVEIATIITDDDLNILAEGPDLVIKVADELLETMDDVVKEMHSSSGLLEQIKLSKVTLKEAGDKTLEFISKYVAPKTTPLAGNSIGTDRRFLARYLPDIENYLSYRSIDVSTIKELCKRWYPSDYEMLPKKSLRHRALEDIKESIDELLYYRRKIFKH
jgi:oligoribonuclease